MIVDVKKFIVDEQPSTTEQVNAFVNSDVFDGQKMRFMPDAHAGKGAVVGSVITYTDRIVPSVVGVDIGCTVSAWPIANFEGNLKKVDKVVNKCVPSGFNVHDCEHTLSKEFPYECMRVWKHLDDSRKNHIRKSMGTLGSGNHFISLEHDDEACITYLVVHCGSRNLGVQVERHYGDLAVAKSRSSAEAEKEAWNRKIECIVCMYHEGKINIDELSSFMGGLREHSKVRSDGLDYITSKDMSNYLNDMKRCQEWAIFNHVAIAQEVFENMGWTLCEGHIICQHNYVDTEDSIIRKGAISAKEGELGIIPLNMRDGSLIIRGKGNEDWLNSAPHGAGRCMSRAEAKRSLSFDDYAHSMNTIYSSSVTESTIDEAPMSYKPAKAIEDAIEPTAEVIAHLRPIYNFKAK